MLHAEEKLQHARQELFSVSSNKTEKTRKLQSFSAFKLPSYGKQLPNQQATNQETP